MENKKYTEEELKKLELEKAAALEREREMILMQADDETKEMVLDFGEDGLLEFKSEIESLTLEEIDDPETKYHLYYNVIDKLLRKHLPKGEKHKEERELIYEEKNTYMTGGHRINDRGIRGADSRMSYVENMQEIINIITEWITTKGTMYDLYIKLRDLNVSKGYGTAYERMKR